MKVVSFKMYDRDLEMLRELTRRLGMTVSDFIRVAVKEKMHAIMNGSPKHGEPKIRIRKVSLVDDVKVPDQPYSAGKENREVRIDCEALIELKKKGYSLYRIGKLYGVSPATVKYWLERRCMDGGERD